jgi:colanic acid/amylovoran biosynthesis glycosyltransferase
MKIAFIVTHFPSLSETFILSQITGLLDQGHQVEIFAVAYSPTEKVHTEIATYQLLQRTHYFAHIPANKVWRVLKAIYLALRYYTPHHLQTLFQTLNVVKHGTEALRLNLLYYALPFLGKTFDIIHCHFGYNGLIGANLKKVGIPGKYLTSFYGNDLTSFIYEYGINLYNDIFVHGDLLLPLCQYFYDKLQAYGCAPEKICIHPVGLDIQTFTPSSPKSPLDGTIQLLTIARLVGQKGYEFAIKALALLVKKHPNIHYTIAGDGPLESDLNALVSQLHLSPYVTFIGAVNQTEMIELYNRSHIFLHPSVTDANHDQEGTPRVLLEAQAMELPIVSTLHSGIPEIVLDQQSGFLVPEKDVEAIAEKLCQLIEHPERRSQMGAIGRTFVKNHFEIHALNRRLLEIYERLISQP